VERGVFHGLLSGKSDAAPEIGVTKGKFCVSELPATAAVCVARVRDILGQARREALQTVNAAMIAAYWYIGREIVEEEQRGRDRADYGTYLIQELSDRLSAEFGRGFSVPNLRLIRQFYLSYRDRYPQIHFAVSSESQDV